MEYVLSSPLVDLNILPISSLTTPLTSTLDSLPTAKLTAPLTSTLNNLPTGSLTAPLTSTLDKTPLSPLVPSSVTVPKTKEVEGAINSLSKDANVAAKNADDLEPAGTIIVPVIGGYGGFGYGGLGGYGYGGYPGFGGGFGWGR